MRPLAFVGETLQRILRDQFERVRDRDRFWCQAYLSERLVREVEAASLAVIIRRNTDIGTELADDVFRAPVGLQADLVAPLGSVDARDAAAFRELFRSGDPRVDLDRDLDFDVDDIELFLRLLNRGVDGR